MVSNANGSNTARTRVLEHAFSNTSVLEHICSAKLLKKALGHSFEHTEHTEHTNTPNTDPRTHSNTDPRTHSNTDPRTHPNTLEDSGNQKPPGRALQENRQ